MSLRPSSRHIIFLVILCALLFSTALKMCKSHAEHIYTPKKPFFAGSFNPFCYSPKPELTTILNGSLCAVHNSAEAGSAQQSVVEYLNLQLEEYPRREAPECTNATLVSLMRTQQTSKLCMV